MKQLISDIIHGKGLQQIINDVIKSLYLNGPESLTDMELLSYFAYYQPVFFKQYENEVLNCIASFYKNVPQDSLRGIIFQQFRDLIKEQYGDNYTPVQASLINKIQTSQYFSFSAPTSTGKSFLFMKMIKESKRDVVVVVPSRALINEYYIKLNSQIKDKSVTILTFIDKVNIARTRRFIFIVTPERCREIFKRKNEFSIEFFIFDEAQLGNEENQRGIFFDGIIRRLQKAFPDSKFIFAHPFVENPSAQITKNNFDSEKSNYIQYTQKNVGQMFICHNDQDGKYYHFALDHKKSGSGYIPCKDDPINQAVWNGGSVLFYVAKTCIATKRFTQEYGIYIKECIRKGRIKESKETIEQIADYIGGNTDFRKNGFSLMMKLMEFGVIIHHGSLPLYVRLLIEEYVKKGFCRLCFATSTLEQGVNMPFDVVVLGKLEGSKSLSVKNIIGRAGRSSLELKFDFGKVVVKKSRVSDFRKIMMTNEHLSEVSMLDSNNIDEDLKDYRDAVNDGTLSDEYNLTEKSLEVLGSRDISEVISELLEKCFSNGQFNLDYIDVQPIVPQMAQIYSFHLKRALNQAELGVLENAIRILFWKIRGRTFKNICWQRYVYVSDLPARRVGLDPDAKFTFGYHDLPDKQLNVFSLFDKGTKGRNVDYDVIVADTYDYLDKLLGNKLSDIYYAAFHIYYLKNKDENAEKMALLFKYGTTNERHIMMMRYGLTFEDIENLEEYIIDIDQNQIAINPRVMELPEEKRKCLERYM